MSTFEEREKSHEIQFARAENLMFRVLARRNRALGLWAANKMGLSETDAESYGRTLVGADLAQPGEEDVFRKLRADFDSKGIAQSDHQIRRMMEELLAQERRHVASDA